MTPYHTERQGSPNYVSSKSQDMAQAESAPDLPGKGWGGCTPVVGHTGIETISHSGSQGREGVGVASPEDR